MSQSPATNAVEKYVVLSGAISLKGGASAERGTVVSADEVGRENLPRLLTLEQPALRRATADEAKLERVSLDKLGNNNAVSREETLTELRTQISQYIETEQELRNKIARMEKALRAAGVDPATLPDESNVPKAGLPNSGSSDLTRQPQQNGGQQNSGQGNQNRQGGQGGGR